MRPDPQRPDYLAPTDGSRGPLFRNAALRHHASTIALGIALILIVAKVWGWWLTGSMVLLISAADALVDALASLATFVGVRYAHRPADLDHRFGHGKAEALAAFTQAVLLATTGLVFGAEALRRLLVPEQLADLEIGLAVAAGSLVTSGFLVAMQSWVLRRTASTAIAADRLHYFTDVAVNLAVLVALALTWLTRWERADPLFAIVIAGYMLWNARQIARNAAVQLLDRELSPEQRTRIEGAVLSCAGAHAVHDLRTRDAGDRVFVEFHLEVAGELSVSEGHAIVDAAECAVAALFPAGSEVIGHVEPAGIVDERLDDRVHTARSG